MTFPASASTNSTLAARHISLASAPSASPLLPALRGPSSPYEWLAASGFFGHRALFEDCFQTVCPESLFCRLAETRFAKLCLRGRT